MSATGTAASEDLGMADERLDVARAMVHDHVASGRAPSVAAIVMRRGEVLLAEAAGVQRPGGPELTLDHTWALASATKPITAAVLMSLVEEGRVGIYEPVIEHLPELAGSTHDDVLVHHLFTHTAGWESPLFSGRMAAFIASGDLPPLTLDRDLLSHIFLTLAFDPIRFCEVGEVMAYANVNYELISEIIRRTTGDTLQAAMQARIFDPLGMDHSALIVPDSLLDNTVRRAPDLPFGEADDTTGLALQGELVEQADAGGAGGFASPRDLATFAQALLDGGIHDGSRILAPSSVRAMTTNQIPGTPAVFGPDATVAEGSWGYGFSVICEQRWPWFGGGLVPMGSVTHPGAGGVNYWIDLEHQIVGVFFEILTEMSDMLEPISGLSHRFQDVITGAVVE